MLLKILSYIWPLPRQGTTLKPGPTREMEKQPVLQDGHRLRFQAHAEQFIHREHRNSHERKIPGRDPDHHRVISGIGISIHDTNSTQPGSGGILPDEGAEALQNGEQSLGQDELLFWGLLYPGEVILRGQGEADLEASLLNHESAGLSNIETRFPVTTVYSLQESIRRNGNVKFR
jgi:hypothetical protein